MWFVFARQALIKPMSSDEELTTAPKIRYGDLEVILPWSSLHPNFSCVGFFPFARAFELVPVHSPREARLSPGKFS